jgi:hypothetical protein
MKKIILSGFAALIVLQSFAYSDSSIDETLQKSFRTSFPNAEKVQWSEEPGFHIVSFVDNGILSRITYDKDGEFNMSVRNYSAENLPYYLVIALRNKYAGHSIYGVTEIASSTTIEYYVKLEGSKDWITVKLDSNGSSALTDKYRKAN